jgi:hypothetical protein
MHNRTVLAAVVLAAFNMFACSEADTSDDAQQESPVVAADGRFVETEQQAPFAGAVRPDVTKEELKQNAVTEPSAYAALAPITAEQANGVAEESSFAPAKRALPIDECRSTYLCTGHGTIVLHREGPSCFLGDILLSPNWTAQYREESGTWSGDATFLDVSFAGVTSHCERK